MQSSKKLRPYTITDWDSGFRFSDDITTLCKAATSRGLRSVWSRIPVITVSPRTIDSIYPPAKLKYVPREVLDSILDEVERWEGIDPEELFPFLMSIFTRLAEAQRPIKPSPPPFIETPEDLRELPEEEWIPLDETQVRGGGWEEAGEKREPKKKPTWWLAAWGLYLPKGHKDFDYFDPLILLCPQRFLKFPPSAASAMNLWGIWRILPWRILQIKYHRTPVIWRLRGRNLVLARRLLWGFLFNLVATLSHELGHGMMDFRARRPWPSFPPRWKTGKEYFERVVEESLANAISLTALRHLLTPMDEARLFFAEDAFYREAYTQSEVYQGYQLFSHYGGDFVLINADRWRVGSYPGFQIDSLISAHHHRYRLGRLNEVEAWLVVALNLLLEARRSFR